MKFSIITPTFNSEKHIEETMRSVFAQCGNFDVEYFIVDNMSSDRTVEIVENNIKNLGKYKKNKGSFEVKFIIKNECSMYEAINHGFSFASGDVYAWINSDDIYIEGAFSSVVSAFNLSPCVKWVKGITNYIDEDGFFSRNGCCYLYAQGLIRRGLYGREAYFIQQDSVFWRSELWQSTGGLDANFKIAGDYHLWMKFAELAPLYSLNRPVSCFRKVKGQLSENLAAYRQEQERIPRPFSPRNWLLGKFFVLLEPQLPDWLKFPLFRLLCPFAPLCCIDLDGDAVNVRKSFRYMV